MLSAVGMSWLDSAVRPNAANTDGEAEQHRDAGGEHGAERDHQDDQRDRDREQLGLLEVAAACRRTPCRSTRRRTLDRRTGERPAIGLAAASIGATLSPALSGSPLIVNGRRAALPFAAGSTGPISPTTPEVVRRNLPHLLQHHEVVLATGGTDGCTTFGIARCAARSAASASACAASASFTSAARALARSSTAGRSSGVAQRTARADLLLRAPAGCRRG